MATSLFEQFLEVDLVAGGVAVGGEKRAAIERECKALDGRIELTGHHQTAAEDIPDADGHIVVHRSTEVNPD